MTPKCEYHDNFDSASAASRHPLSREAQPCLFDRLAWYEELHGAAYADRKPLLISARHEMAEGWLALVRARAGHYLSLANWYSFTWSPVFANAHSEITRLALLRSLAAAAAAKAWRLTLSPVPEEDDSLRLLRTAFEQEGWVVEQVMCDENHILNVRGRTFDDYWQARPGQLRNTVRRKGNKGVVSIRIETHFTEEAWADYQSIYARSWKPEEGNPEFLRALAEQEGHAGALRLGLAYIDGQPVAAQFWTVENGRALIHKLAHDERHIKASPGTLLTTALFQHVIDVDCVDIVDFGTGSDPYKRDWMEEMRPRYRLDMFRPAHPMSWPYLIRNAIRRLSESRANRLAVKRHSD